MRPTALRLGIVAAAALLATAAVAATARPHVIYRPARYALKPGCKALVSRDECRRVIVQPRLVRVWSWGGFVPASHWTDWNDWG